MGRTIGQAGRGFAALVLLVAALAVVGAAGTPARADVLKYAGDQLNTGWYPDHPGLSPQLVGGGTFGQLFDSTLPDRGSTYGQPVISNGTLLVATEEDHAYGLDPTTGAVRWSVGLGTPFNPSDIGCGDLVPHVGVTGTPVVDPATGTAYLVAKSYVSGTTGATRQQLHALDVASGAERPGFPVTIAGTADNDPGSTFGAASSNTLVQRTGLTIVDGVVYVGFAGHCDYAGQNAFQGWVFGVGVSGTARSGQITARFTTEAGQSPNAGAGVWQSGGSILSDGPGQLLLTTGNGVPPAQPTPGDRPGSRLGQAVVRLTVQPDGTLAPTDFFAPYDADHLNLIDGDLGSGAPLGLPSSYQGTPLFGTAAMPHLNVQVGKEGYVYLLNRDHLGGYQQGPGGSDAAISRVGPDGGTWSKPAVWPGDGGYVFNVTSTGTRGGYPAAGTLHAYKYGLDGSGRPSLSLVATSLGSDGNPVPFEYGSTAGVVTSDGIESGSAVLWAVNVDPYGTGELRAYDAKPVGGAIKLLGHWPVGLANKFALPAVDGNRVYVATRDGHVRSFGSPVNSPFEVEGASLPRTTVGQTGTGSLTVTANANLTITGVSSDNPAVVPGLGGLPLAVSSGQQVTVPLQVSPTKAGPVSATIHLETSLAGFDVAVSGQAQVDGPLLSAAPALVSFGSVPVDPTNGPSTQAVTLTNYGSAVVHVTGVDVPDGGPFSASGVPVPGTAGATVEPGESTTVTASFKPTTTGPVTGTIALDTDGPTACAPPDDAGAPPTRCTIDLSGVGTPKGHLTVSAPPVASAPVGGSADTSFTVTNDGGSPVTITKSKPPLADGLAATTRLDEGTVLQPGVSLTLTVRFTPTAVTGSLGAWSITGDDGTGLHSVVVGGLGTVPKGYVAQVYQDLLGRAPDPDGQAYWTAQLAKGVPFDAVAASIVTSPEYEGRQVSAQYQALLRRAPEPGGLAYWSQQLAQGTHTPELQSLLGSSDEYVTSQAAGDPGSRYVDALYRDALRRAPDQAGHDYYTVQLFLGVRRDIVARWFFYSDEALRNLITDDYQALLRRAPDAGGLAYWAGRVQAGSPDQQVVVLLVSSLEYVSHTG